MKRPALVLSGILLASAVLRLAGLGTIPPGLNVDEASNVWNAHSLLDTGLDEHGKPWPVLYTEAFGENRSTVYVYALLPFEAAFGMGEWTARLPAALAGVLTVWLVYWVAARLFDPQAGLAAAAILAVSPWHLLVCRWAFEASLTPFLILGSLAACLWAGVFELSDRSRPPRIGRAIVAGVLCAASCYGYWAVRIFLPLFLLTAVLLTVLRRGSPDSRERRRAILALGTAFAATLGPLVWGHLVDTATLAHRGLSGLAWSATDPLVIRIAKVARRYAGHFGPGFLFLEGDRFPPLSLPRGGVLQLYTLPLVLYGIWGLWKQRKASRAPWLLFAWLALYPVADLLKDHPGSHILRSLPGLPLFVLLAAVGLVEGARVLYERSSRAAWIGAGILTLAAVATDGAFLSRFYGTVNREASRYHGNQADLMDAFRWLRPKLDDIDAVFCTTRGFSFPYVSTLVALRYDARRWQQDEKAYSTDGEWETCTRYGKVRFLYDRRDYDALRDLLGNGRRDRVALIARPDELPLQKLGVPSHEVLDPEGKPSLVVYTVDL